ncbi:MAG: sugar transferase [Deltaproteobacteria bacterium]|nr:sugar transferase [Deltaproteobacteria bacterium]
MQTLYYLLRMFQRRHHIYRRLNNLLDAFLTACVFSFVYLLRNNLAQVNFLEDLGHLPPFRDYLPLMVLASLFWPISLNYHGLYNPNRLQKAFVNVEIIFRSSLVCIFLLIGIIFLFQMETVSRLFLVSFGFTNAFALVLKNLLMRQYGLHRRLRGKDIRSVLIVGTLETAREAVQKIRRESHLGLKPVGIVLPEGQVSEDIEGVPVMGTLAEWRQILHDCPVAHVLFTIHHECPREVETALGICQEEGVEGWLFAHSFGWNLSPMEIDYFSNIPVFVFRSSPVLNWAYVFKILLDRLLAFLFIVILSPLFLGVAALIFVTSGGPILYKQKRVGRFGQRFDLYKFRSIEKGGKSVTRFGKWLRHTGLDELPQLVNILKGEMSFVGPRPHIPEEVSQYREPWQRRRFRMLPGLTCYRQILRSGKVSFDESMALDLEYINKWSLWVDFFLIFKTMVVLCRRLGNQKEGG